MAASNTSAGLMQSLAHERVLFRCVLVSFALHALLLFGMPSKRTPAPAAKSLPVLTARLEPFAQTPRAPARSRPAEPAPPEPASAPAPPQSASATHPLPAQPSAVPAPVVKKTAPAEPARTPRPESESATAPGAETSAAPPPASTRTKPATAVPGGKAAAVAAASSGSEADKGNLEQYRRALIVATRRYKRYPAIALEKGWQGRVDVHIVVGADGMLASASIKGGSGHEILDNQALDMLKKGKTTVAIPAGLRGREFSIDVPVIFNLDSPNS